MKKEKKGINCTRIHRSVKNHILLMVKRGRKLPFVGSSTILDMLQLYSSIRDKLLQPINEETAVILLANTWLEFISVSLAFDTAQYHKHTRKMFYLHTWNWNKSLCDTSNVCFETFAAFDRWIRVGKNSRKRIQNRKVLLIFFPPICYIEFSASFSSCF